MGIRTSIIRKQNTAAQYIPTRPILDLCEQATQRPGVRVSRRWWEQTGIYLNGAREKAVAAAAEAETKSESEDDPDRAAVGGGDAVYQIAVTLIGSHNLLVTNGFLVLDKT